MFLFHVAIGIGVIALILAVSFLMHIKKKADWRNGWTIFAGYVVVIIAALSLICSIYNGFKYKVWNHKYMMEMMHRNK